MNKKDYKIKLKPFIGFNEFSKGNRHLGVELSLTTDFYKTMQLSIGLIFIGLTIGINFVRKYKNTKANCLPF